MFKKIVSFLALTSFLFSIPVQANFRPQIPGVDYYESASGGSGTVNSGTAGFIAYYAGTGDTVSAQGVIYTDGTNIGIGTTSPQYKLDVNGTARFNGTEGLILANGAGLKTSTVAANTALLQAYNTGTTSYTTFGTLTAGSSPTFDLAAATTIGGLDIVSRTGTQTITNKTLVSPIISSISNTGTITLPTSTDTLVGRATTDTLTNKTLTSPKIGTSLQATDGTNYFTYSTPGSAVNYLAYANAVTGTDPSYTVTGDANRGITYNMAGTGGMTVVSTNTGPSTIKRGLTVNNDSNNGSGDSFTVKTPNSSTAFVVDASADKVNVGVVFNLAPRASPPGSPVSGDLYMDSTPNPDELCGYDGSAWQALFSGTDANCA